MDSLTDRNEINYEYMSRYSGIPYYYNKRDKKYIYGLTRQLNQNTPCVRIKINEYTTLDFLAQKYYGRPDLFWLIAEFNGILDPFQKLYPTFTELLLPSVSNLEYKE